MIRFSYIKNSLSMLDAIPEMILINSHDATSADYVDYGLSPMAGFGEEIQVFPRWKLTEMVTVTDLREMRTRGSLCMLPLDEPDSLSIAVMLCPIQRRKAHHVSRFRIRPVIQKKLN